jgi:hypothetical protein
MILLLKIVDRISFILAFFHNYVTNFGKRATQKREMYDNAIFLEKEIIPQRKKRKKKNKENDTDKAMPLFSIYA